MGDVWEATDTRRGNAVAIKAARWKSPEVELLLRREFRLAEELWHPNLVRHHELISLRGETLLVMERLVQTPLDEWLGLRRDPVRMRDPAPADSEMLRAAVVQIAAGVAALHTGGLLHLDLKPDNVLVQPDGRAVVIDYGLAMRRGEARHSPSGTPGYMAPEQVNSGPALAASDWYAFGVILAQGLTGAPPTPRAPRPELGALRWERDPLLAALAYELLDPVPERRPSGEEVLARLGIAPMRTPARPFVGRGDELAALESALDSVRAHRLPEVAWVRGGSGSGKSALVDAFARRCQGRCVTLFSRVSPRDALPFKALDPILEAARSRLDGVASGERGVAPEFHPLGTAFPGMRWGRQPDAGAPVAREALVRAFAALLRRLAADAPLVIILDDAQWSDTDSVSLLEDGLAEARTAPVLVVLAVRDDADAASAVLDRVLPTRTAIRLGPLNPGEVAEFARLTMPDADVAAVVEQSGGQPFLLALLSDSRDRVGDVRSAVVSAIRSLPEHSRRALAMVALASFPLTLGQVAEQEDGADPMLDGLRVLRLAREWGVGDDARLEVYHEQVRTGLLALLTPEEATDAHRALVEVLGPDGDPFARCQHLLGAGDVRAAALAARIAGTQALAGLAFARAVELLRIAATASTRPDPELDELLGRALEGAGRCAEAAVCFESAASAIPGTRLRAARMYFFAGDLDRGLAASAPLLQDAGLEIPEANGQLQARLMLGVARLLLGIPSRHSPETAALALSVEEGLVSLEPMRAALLALDTVPGRLRDAEGAELALCRSRLAILLASLGRLNDRTRALQREAEADLQRLEPEFALKILVNRAKLSLMVGDLRDARVQADAAAGLAAEAHCESTLMPSVTRNLGLFAAEALGDLPDLARRADDAERRGRSVGDRCAEVTVELYRAMLDLAADDPDRSLARVDAALNRWPVSRFTFQHWLALRNRVLALVYAGRLDAARVAFDGDRRPLKSSRMSGIPFVAAQVRRLEWLLEPPGAPGWLAASPRWPPADTHALAASVLKCLASAEHLEEARSAAEASGLTMHAAACEWSLGTRTAVCGVANPSRWFALYLARPPRGATES